MSEEKREEYFEYGHGDGYEEERLMDEEYHSEPDPQPHVYTIQQSIHTSNGTESA